MQKRVFRVYFVPEKYVFRVCFESTFTRMISSLKYKCPPEKSLWLGILNAKNIKEGSEEGRKEGRRRKSPIVIFTYAFPNRPTHKYLPLTESHQYVHRPTQNWKEGFLNLLNGVWLKSPGKTSEKLIEISFVVQDYGCLIATHLICESIGFNYKIIGWASLF